MQHFKKIKKLNQQKAQKQYALSTMISKKKPVQSDYTSSFIKYSIIENQYTKQQLSAKQPEQVVRSKSQGQSFTIKNLDNNKVQVIDLSKADNFIQTMDKKYMQQIRQLPQIEALLDKMWNQYLSEVQKEEQQFLQACYQGDIKKVKKIVGSKGKHPIDPTLVTTIEGQNGIHLATASGSYRNIQIIALLKSYKVNIDGRTKQELRTPLILGCILANFPAVKALLELGAEPNLQDYQGNTALHHVCYYEQQPLVQLLLDYSCSLETKNNKNLTPIQCIQKTRIFQIVKAHPKYNQLLKSPDKISNSQQEHIKKLLGKQKQGGQENTRAESQSCFSFSQQKMKVKVNSRHQKITQVTIKEVASISSFKKISMLGRGAFGQVFLVQNIIDHKRYAMKCLDKNLILQQNILRYVMTQKKILSTINHPFIVRLHFAFQTSTKLILIMDYCPGGDLLKLIKKKGAIEQKHLKNYICELVLALEELHKAQIIYRDLKPGNVVIDKQGHALLTDFGLSKEASLSHSFCGSTAYLAPEMLWRRGHTKVLDWYLLGMLIYEALTGRPPFWDINKQNLLNNIKSGRYKHLDKTQFSAQLINLVDSLLRANTMKRLGYKGAKQIKTHPWFNDVNWQDVQNRRLVMQILPENQGKLIKQQIFDQQPHMIKNKIEGWEFSPEN